MLIHFDQITVAGRCIRRQAEVAITQRLDAYPLQTRTELLLGGQIVLKTEVAFPLRSFKGSKVLTALMQQPAVTILIVNIGREINVRQRTPVHPQVIAIAVTTGKFLGTAKANFPAERQSSICAVVGAGIQTLTGSKGAIAKTVQIIITLGEVLEAQVDPVQIIQRDGRADYRHGIVGAITVQTLLVAQEGTDTDITRPAQVGLDPLKTIPGFPDVIAILVTKVIDVDGVIQVGQVQGVFKALPR